MTQEDSDGKGDDTVEWGDEGTSLAGTAWLGDSACFGEPLVRFSMFCLAVFSAVAIVPCPQAFVYMSAGRLGQAYVAGYNCNTEEELQQVCGFRSFRT